MSFMISILLVMFLTALYCAFMRLRPTREILLYETVHDFHTDNPKYIVPVSVRNLRKYPWQAVGNAIRKWRKKKCIPANYNGWNSVRPWWDGLKDGELNEILKNPSGKIHLIMSEDPIFRANILYPRRRQLRSVN